MFAGSVCLDGLSGSSGINCSRYGYGDALFHPVICDCFSGGFWLHPRLPYGREDTYYQDDSEDILVLLSGRVYNKSSLAVARSLSADLPDPLLIAKLFIADGPVFAERLNGDFAFFILRPGRREAFLYRDHIGILPLAWITEGNTLTFSTDITGLCRSHSRGGSSDTEFFLSWFKYIDYRRTPNPDVRKTEPGHFIHFTPEGLKCVKYWFPEKISTDRALSYERMITDLGELLQDSVRIRCDSRFTAGAHVSGGLDSGVVSSLARREYSMQELFPGFSWSPEAIDYSGDKPDERLLVRSSCTMAGIEPVFSRMDEDLYRYYISRSYYSQGYFIEDETSDRAAAEGVNLLFSGWGGDEFISTGHSGIDLDLLRGLKPGLFFRRNPAGNPKKFIRRFLFYVVYPVFHILPPGSARGFRRDAKYILRSYARSDRVAISSFFFHSSRRRMHLNVLRFYGIPERCESWYMLGFRKGVEYRYPLLDRRIIEYMLKVPSELLCRTGLFRPVLRELGRGLIPEEVRLNEDKNDHLFWEHTDSLYRRAAMHFMDEAGGWKENPDMKFVDFRLLLKDIAEFRSKGSVPDEAVLFKTVVWLKAIHEYTVRYREDNVR